MSYPTPPATPARPRTPWRHVTGAGRRVEINPWLSRAPCSVRACLPEEVAAAGRARRAARLSAALLVLLTSLPVFLVMGAAPRLWRARIVRAAARLLLRALGVRVEVTESEPPACEAAGLLVVANHVSLLDPVVMLAALPCRLLAKQEVRGWPLIGTLGAACGALFIDRERLSTLPVAVGLIRDALRAGEAVAVFPEGTTSCGREVGTFRPAVFQAAIDAGAAVCPAVLRYYEGESRSSRGSWVGEDTLPGSLLRVAGTRRLRAEVRLTTLLRPAAPGPGPKARAALAHAAEERVRAGLD
ncbi:lysophospholipid acyltransferase family protein [Nonomuraea spiralis]|uniref:Lysophospholipid acyltransferase family protein n=1 Tax=Nonomuraea spiralis TaxID=46182 RepID=A0ABV5I4X8_9ACTN|nr:lysophospholipid acyltransferase family protein [Nonomuraea spiralis]GGS62331.1 1-acyl-sn-glycerol-3-phosphate acyltransferase [Nonomuraea spiralis]